MNLCFICNKWSETGDGKNLIAVLNGLNLRGHEITVISLCDEKSPDGFDRFRFFCIGRHGNPISVWKAKRILLRRLMNEHTFDAVLCFGEEAALFSLCAKKEMGCPVIFCERSDPEFSPENALMQTIRDKLFATADAYIFQCKKQKRYFTSNKIRKNCYLIHDFPCTKGTNYAHEPKEKVILCNARLDARQKNLYMLFDGFIEFAKTYPEYTLKLYGEGADREKCMEYIRSKGSDWNIKLPGVCENPEEELKRAEVFVLTSNFEGTPNELLPAMSAGCTCICTNCGCASELIVNGQNGIVIDINDSKTLTEALCYLAENEEMRIKLGDAAFEINQTLTEENTIPLWEKAITEVIEKKAER
ncbi:MAG: glycosyltransferase [Clostridia bacterium]|nr:glycosyltransferase [Clostridia bacterium]